MDYGNTERPSMHLEYDNNGQTLDQSSLTGRRCRAWKPTFFPPGTERLTCACMLVCARVCVRACVCVSECVGYMCVCVFLALRTCNFAWRIIMRAIGLSFYSLLHVCIHSFIPNWKKHVNNVLTPIPPRSVSWNLYSQGNPWSTDHWVAEEQCACWSRTRLSRIQLKRSSQ